MPSIKTIGSISDTHEQGLNGDFTNIVKVTAQAKYKKWSGSFSVGSYGTSDRGSLKNVPLLEAKLGHDLSENTNFALRYRKHGNTNQVRAIFGAEHNIDSTNRYTLSAETYLNLKKEDNKKWNEKIGAEIGCEYKVNNRISLYAGLEHCIQLEKNILKELSNLDNTSANIKLTYKF